MAVDSEKNTADLLKALSVNFKGNWNMLRQVIEKVPDEKWNSGICECEPVDKESKYWFFSFVVYHVVETADFYIRSTPDGMIWGGRAGFNWDDVNDIKGDILPKITKELVVEYLNDTEEQLDSFFSNSTVESLLEKDGFHWFSSIFSKLIYLLRHITYHAGELGRMLREWQCELLHWE